MTDEEIANCSTFFHASRRNKNGTAVHARRNGKTQRWKREPNRFRIPIKIGFRGYGEITERDTEWLTADPTNLRLIFDRLNAHNDTPIGIVADMLRDRGEWALADAVMLAWAPPSRRNEEV